MLSHAGSLCIAAMPRSQPHANNALASSVPPSGARFMSNRALKTTSLEGRSTGSRASAPLIVHEFMDRRGRESENGRGSGRQLMPISYGNYGLTHVRCRYPDRITGAPRGRIHRTRRLQANSQPSRGASIKIPPSLLLSGRPGDRFAADCLSHLDHALLRRQPRLARHRQRFSARRTSRNSRVLSLETYPRPPTPGNRRFPPKCVTKPELRYEGAEPRFGS